MSGDSWEGRCSAARMPQKAKSKVICEASISVIRSYDRTKDIDAHTHFTPPYFMRRLAAAEAAALPVISRAIEGQVFHLRKSSTSCPAIIISPYETRTLFRILEKAFPTLSKNRPACGVTHIGPEENYLKCSSTRLKCSFGLLGALFFNHLQNPKIVLSGVTEAYILYHFSHFGRHELTEYNR